MKELDLIEDYHFVVVKMQRLVVIPTHRDDRYFCFFFKTTQNVKKCIENAFVIFLSFSQGALRKHIHFWVGFQKLDTIIPKRTIQ